MTLQLLPFFQHMVIKCGSNGVLVGMHLLPEIARKSSWRLQKTDPARRQVVCHTTRGHLVVLKHFPAAFVEQTSIVNVTGAGDSLVGSLLASLTATGRSTPTEVNIFHDPDLLDEAMNKAQSSAVMTLQSTLAVSPLINSGKRF